MGAPGSCRAAAPDKLQGWGGGCAGRRLGVLRQWGLSSSKSSGQSTGPHSPGAGQSRLSARHRAGLRPTPTERRLCAGLFQGEPSRGDGSWAANGTAMPRHTRASSSSVGLRAQGQQEVASTPESPADLPLPQPTCHPSLQTSGAQRGPLCMVESSQSPSGVPLLLRQTKDGAGWGHAEQGGIAVLTGGPAPLIGQVPVGAR